MRRLGALWVLLFTAAMPQTAIAATPLTALAPIETILDAQTELVGVAVSPDGTRYVSDRSAGVVYRINASGVATAIVTGLARPAGLALDADGRLLIAEEQAGRVLSLEPSGALTVLATGIKTPRWIAVSPGSLYVSAHRLSEPEGADVAEGRVIVRLAPGSPAAVVASGIRRLEGLVRLNGSLIAATKGLEAGPSAAGMLLRYPVLADGALGTPTTWLGEGLKQPVGLVLDALGGVFVAAKELRVKGDVSKRAVGKIQPEVRLSEFAANLGDPQGVAVGPDGSLYLADGRAGRLLRFAPPAAPALSVPEFTARTPLTVTGTTVAGARVDVFVNEATTAVSAVTDAAGAFALALAVTPNAVSTLEGYATTYGGEGLTSAAVTASVRHDDVAPSLGFQAPPEGAHVSGTVAVEARASDDGSAVAALTLTVDGHSLEGTVTPPPPGLTVTATGSWVTPGVGNGLHTVSASAADRAGNTASVTRTVTVDNTPPDTQITGGPLGFVKTATVAFAFAGSDNLTPASRLVFAWRLDRGAWSAFSNATVATVSGLGEGAHTFEVKAKDLAGNEDPTPATRTFTVDGTAPVVAFQAPAASVHVRQSVIVQAQAADAGGVASVTLSADGQGLPGVALLPAPPAVTVTATAIWDTTTVADGPRMLTATASDQAGNVASATRGVIVDNTPPEAAITSGRSGPMAERTATLVFTGSDNLAPTSELVFAWRLVSDGAQGAFTPFSATTTATFSDLVDGSYTFEVKARDLAGNESETAIARWVVDTTAPPAPAIATELGDPTNQTTATFTVSDDEGGVTLLCDLDGGGFWDCTAGTVSYTVAAGLHTLTVTARDAAGNESGATYTWTVDVTPPETTIVTGPRSPTRETSATFTLEASEAATFGASSTVAGSRGARAR